VIAAPDADGVAAIAFYYAPKPEVEACAEECLQRCAAALPLYQRPRWMRRVDALPRTPTGKLLRRKLLDLHATDFRELPVAHAG
jgi:acyl-coenzyme A synthetase/AMP-(fatty) acid ligase